MRVRHSLPKRTLYRYIAIVLVPTLIIYGLSVGLLVRQVIGAENQRKEYQLSLMERELDSSLALIEAIPFTLRQNEALMAYLDYPYKQDWEAVYAYMKDIRPSLKYMLSVTPTVGRLILYGAEDMLNLGGYYRPMSSLPIRQSELGTGRWLWDEQALTYLYPLWDSQSNRCTGVIRLELSVKAMDALSRMDADGNLLLLDSAGTILYGDPNGEGRRELRLPVSRTGHTLALRYSEIALVGPAVWWVGVQGAVLLALLILLSMVYLRTSYRIANRLSRFATYIRSMRDGDYQSYNGDLEADEIGEVIAAFNDLAHRTDVLVNEVQRAELLRRQAEYNAYQAKIEPHFLYGTLDSVRMMAEENGDDAVADTVLQFAKLMRYSLTDGDGTVTLGAEMQQVRRYLDLQMLRYGRRIRYEIEVESPELLKLECPQFILQPLAENSLMHGLKDCVTDGIIVIRLLWHDGAAEAEVKDNGTGIEPERLSELKASLNNPCRYSPEKGDASYALFNINTRLKMYFGPGSGVRMGVNEWGGLTCTLRMERKKCE